MSIKDFKTNWIYVILLILILIALIPYIVTFDGGLSTDNSVWGEFGSYLSGVSALLNVIVFYLTNSIDTFYR